MPSGAKKRRAAKKKANALPINEIHPKVEENPILEDGLAVKTTAAAAVELVAEPAAVGLGGNSPPKVDSVEDLQTNSWLKNDSSSMVKLAESSEDLQTNCSLINDSKQVVQLDDSLEDLHTNDSFNNDSKQVIESADSLEDLLANCSLDNDSKHVFQLVDSSEDFQTNDSLYNDSKQVIETADHSLEDLRTNGCFDNDSKQVVQLADTLEVLQTNESLKNDSKQVIESADSLEDLQTIDSLDNDSKQVIESADSPKDILTNSNLSNDLSTVVELVDSSAILQTNCSLYNEAVPEINFNCNFVVPHVQDLVPIESQMAGISNESHDVGSEDCSEIFVEVVNNGLFEDNSVKGNLSASQGDCLKSKVLINVEGRLGGVRREDWMELLKSVDKIDLVTEELRGNIRRLMAPFDLASN